jgi:RNA polymerase sigma-70 factor (ECF subfamily)
MAETPISLLEQLQRNPDDAAWRRLVDLYMPLLQRWVRNCGVQAADADDLSQEALMAVVKSLPTFQHNHHPGAFRRWLRVILVHRLLPFFRSRKHRTDDNALQQLQDLEDPTSPASQQWDLEHDRHVVGRLLELIRPEFQATTWQAFRRLGLDGASGEDAAQELGISVNAAIVAKCRVLNRLRELARGLVDY